MNSVLDDYIFKVASSEYELQNAFQLRHQVYCEEKKWLSSENFPDGFESDEYDEKAVHVIAMDEDFKVVGYIRILPESAYPILPYVNHPALAGKHLHYPELAELSRFIIKSKSNSLFIARGILKVVWQTCMNMGLENWMIICEPSLIRLIVKFKYYFEPVSAPVMYYGGFTQPAVLNANQTLNKWETSDREAWEFYHKEVSSMKPGQGSTLSKPA